MSKVFFTYVWGAPGSPAWPLTFGSKGARTQARNVLSEGDLVFTVGTQGEPTERRQWGRVLGVYQVSDLEVNTQDYINQLPGDTIIGRAAKEFPFALHPIAVWDIVSPDNVFSQLVGSLSGGKYLKARTTVVELAPETAAPLLALERRQVALAEPQTSFGRGLVAKKNSKLAPKHEGDFSGSYKPHDVWFVYALALTDARQRDLAFKIGYSNDPAQRRDSYQSPMANEVTGLSWRVALQQPTSSEDEARQVEQLLLKRFEKHKLESNGEIISGPNEACIATAIADVMRSY